MSFTAKALVSIVGAIITKKVIHLASELDIDDMLRPIGLMRQRSHWGETFLVLGAGVALGGAAVLLLSPSTEKAIRNKVSGFVDGMGPKEAEQSRDSVSVDGVQGNGALIDLHSPA